MVPVSTLTMKFIVTPEVVVVFARSAGSVVVLGNGLNTGGVSVVRYTYCTTVFAEQLASSEGPNVVLYIDVTRIPEPRAEFSGPTLRADPKVGLRESGPFSLRYGDDQPGAVRLGIVGPAEMVEGTRRWFERCQKRILSAKKNGDALR